MPGPEAERQRDQRDEQERGDDAPDAGAPLALGVEVALGEDQQHHEHEEGQPFRLRLPERLGVRAPPVVHVADDERRVEPEPEPEHVEGRERRDAQEPPREPRDT